MKNLIQKYKKFFFGFILILLIFLIDRISKIYVISLTKENFNINIYTSEFLNFTLIWNEGIAFGLFSFNETYLYNVLTGFILVIIFIILIMIFKSEGFKKYSLLMIFGGALSNVFDRIFYKAVPDFIDIHYGELHWFIFNFADIFITIGVIFMILYEIIDNNSEKNEKN